MADITVDTTDTTGGDQNRLDVTPAQDPTQKGGEPAPTGQPTPAQDFNVPDIYKEKKWSENIKSVDDLWKQHDNAQGLIGKKTIGVPNEKSTDEEWADFNNKMAPKNTEYEFDKNSSEEDKVFLKDVFIKNGINKKAGDNVIKSYNEYFSAKLAQSKSKEDFNKKVMAKFGNNEVVASVDSIVKKYSSEEDKHIFGGLTNDQLLSVVSLVNAIKLDYGIKNGSKLNNGKIETGKQMPDNQRAQELTKELLAKQAKGGLSHEEERRMTKAIRMANGLKD